MSRKSTYDKFPFIAVDAPVNACVVGWQAIFDRIGSSTPRGVIAIETYPGVLDDEILGALRASSPAGVLFLAKDVLKSEVEIRALTAREFWAEDAVLGRMTTRSLIDLFDADKLAALKKQIKGASSGTVIVYGVGATLLCEPDLIVYADMARWEIQRRQRAKLVHGIGIDDSMASAWEQYKRGFFIDWRLADKHKQSIWNRIDFLLDTNTPNEPKLVKMDAVHEGLRRCVTRPFRVVPFFDPGAWGGHWMEDVCDLDRSAPNHAWCFDCVPEENSLLLGFGDHRVEIPSIDLVFQQPRELLGEAVFGRFGAEFPIRFDFLDTMGGGNLSLQVHPLTSYIQQTFGMPYTQDESYYLLDANDDACVYLGFKPDVKPDEFIAALNSAQAFADALLDVERFVNKLPAKKHDHFLIPAGTIHCSGRNSMVLEISATPYIFTHKLWDWGRLDLNGKPRPISIHHGKHNLQYDRDTNYVMSQLVNQVQLFGQGEGWRVERTGLHEAEFIETWRYWFTKTVPLHTKVSGSENAGVHVLNLVEGEEITVESPTGAFDPYVIHYAETFIVPAAVGAYTIRPSGPSVGKECAVVKAFVRT
jgi:mannose-6-phosphate isomerase class I